MPHDGRVKQRRAAALLVGIALAALGFGPLAAPTQAAVVDKLPDLAMLAPFDIRLETSPTGRRLLRFSTVVVNLGSGPFRLYGYDPTDGVASIGDTLKVRQRILRSDGTYRERSTTATMVYVTADGHNHFHVQDLQRFKLQTLGGTTLKNTAKTGFCFLDTYVYGSTKPSYFNGNVSVCQVSPAKTVTMGVSSRWGDIYKSNIAFQWIDITGLASGDYVIKTIADPPWDTGGRFTESNESNNRGWAKIRLTKTTVTVLAKSAKP
jgi:hypothetical protein